MNKEKTVYRIHYLWRPLKLIQIFYCVLIRLHKQDQLSEKTKSVRITGLKESEVFNESL